MPRLGELLKERHLIDLAQRRDPRADLAQARIAEEGHALFPGHALDLRSRAAVDNHLADAVGEIEKLADGSRSKSGSFWSRMTGRR